MDAMRSDVANNDLRVTVENIHDEPTKGDNGVEINDVTGLKFEEYTGPELNTTDSTCLDSAKESMVGLSSTT
nr:hypothetical protein [Tanacetum cinerariifolium]